MFTAPRSFWVLILSLPIFIASLFYFGTWADVVRGGDSWGYYTYLPATFIHKDLDDLHKTQEFTALRRKEANPRDPATGTLFVHEAPLAPSGKPVIKYTMGVAMLQLPFFEAANLLTNIVDTHDIPDGYGYPYSLLVAFSTLTYFFIGMWLLRRVLLQFYSDAEVALTLFALAFATNAYYFATFNVGMSHLYLFFLYAALLNLTVAWHRRPTRQLGFGIGFVVGFITLIRPVELLSILIPITFGLEFTRAAIRERVMLLWARRADLVAAVVAAVAVGTPQLLYWKHQTGHFLYNSYPGEHFDFRHPNIYEGLFSYTNGWLTYTPVMWLALLGIPFMRKGKHFFATAVLLLPPYLYIIYSWWCWQYIYGFGSRPMVEMYPILAFGVVSLYAVAKKRAVTRYMMLAVVVFCATLNVFQTYQINKGLLWTEISTRRFFFRTMFHTDYTYNDLVAMDTNEYQPDSTHLTHTARLASHYYEDSTDTNNVTSTADDDPTRGKVALLQNSAKLIALHKTLEQIGAKPNDFIHAHILAKADKWTGFYRMNTLLIQVKREEQYTRWESVRIESKLKGEYKSVWEQNPNHWAKVGFWLRIPASARPTDELIVLVNQEPDVPNIKIDDFIVDLWREK